MNSLFRFILIILLQACSFLVFAQKNLSGIWYFGQNAGISFNNGIYGTAITNGNMNTPEGCAVLTDPQGHLLFYTNGTYVWDKNHNIMPDGYGLNGNPGSTQPVIIVPCPHHTDFNYIFTLDKEGGSKGLQYSVAKINISLQVGSIIHKNIPLLSPVAEKIVNVKHCNQTDEWVIVHKWNSDAFYAYLIDSSGINTTPVISSVGMTYTGSPLNTIGYMKASYYGDRLAVAHSAAGIIEIFYFDNSTGVVHSPLTIGNMDHVYGLEFSKDGDILYCTTITGKIYAFDLSPGSQVADSKKLIGTSTSLLGAMQRGPDDLIYVARDLSHYLGILDNNNSWSYVTYQDNGLYLNGKKSEAGLPPMIYESYYYEVKASPLCFGDSTYFLFGDSIKIDSISWDFGDTLSLNLNYSNSFYPYHIFSHAGIFTVKAVYLMCGELDSITIHVCIDTVPVFTLPDSLSFCEGTSMTIHPHFEVPICKIPQFAWSDGSTMSYISVNSTGKYYLTVTNNCGTWTDSVEIVDLFPAPVLDLGNDTSICHGDSVILDAGNGHIACTWSTGDTVQTITVYNDGIYWAKVENIYGCETTDYFTLTVNYAPEVYLGSDTTICTGSSLILDPGTGTGNYIWQDGSGEPVFYVSKSGQYWVNVSNFCGQATDSIVVDVIHCNTSLYAPNAFTPNGDGNNDEFLLKGLYVNEFYIKIYNRWGQLVFESDDLHKGWDGRYKHKNCKNDVYIWVVDYKDYYNEHHILNGQVVLVR